MLLVFAPLAKPQDVLWCGRYLTQRTLFDFGCFSKLYCSLDPRVEVMLVLWLQCFLHRMIGVPVNAGD